MELLGPGVCHVFSFIESHQTFSQSGRTVSHLHQQSTTVPIETSCQRFVLQSNFSHSGGCVVISQGGFNTHLSEN